MKSLVLGGARSGKSRYAQQLAETSGLKVVYVATATPGDTEMQQRIEQHQQDRPEHWQLIEEPLDLVGVLNEFDQAGYCVLVDCLTLWLSNLLAVDSAEFDQLIEQLVKRVEEFKQPLILVSNEVGQGIVPMGELSRRFVDESGRLHQQLAQVCDHVCMVIAGLPQKLK